MKALIQKKKSILPQVLILVLILSFTGLIFGGYSIYKEQAPMPKVVSDKGTVLFTDSDIKGGQAAFLRFGLMNYGSIYGHGGYLGEDFTAGTLHRMSVEVQKFYANEKHKKDYSSLNVQEKAGIDQLVQNDMKTNRYDAATNTLKFTAAQTAAYAVVSDYYTKLFSGGSEELRIPAGLIPNAPDAAGSGWHSDKALTRQLSDYFTWTAWTSAANRAGLDYSYTNNWPGDKLAGNVPASGVMIWSAVSIAGLLSMLGIILVLYKKYKLESEETNLINVTRVEDIRVTTSQVKTAKFFVVVAALFIVQALVGTLTAHYFVEGTFFGIKISDILPYQLTRTWHLQIAIFWIATGWIGGGIFIAPMVGRKEPKYQGLLVDILFVAVVAVAVGSLTGEFLGIHNLIGDKWFLFGNQGWEYLELGRIWQVLLAIGLAIWLFIIYRAIRYQLKREGSASSLTHLLLYASISIPLFYASAFMMYPDTSFVIADFWRWFVVHLWVESFFELFATVVTAFLLVNLGLVTKESATRAIQFTLTLVFGAGIIGIGHHYYWIGASQAWMAVSSVFSAIEVIPLTLLVFDALTNHQLRAKLGANYQYRSSVEFLISSAFWNFVGAGILGFLINPPIISYYEHGTYLTATHGHAAMFGVYGMISLGFMIFALRTIVKPEAWNEKRISLSCKLLNIGLVLMLVMNLLPVGFLQLQASLEFGTWYARSWEFVGSPIITTLSWARMPADIVFLVGAALLLFEVVRMFFNLRKPNDQEVVPDTKVKQPKSASI